MKKNRFTMIACVAALVALIAVVVGLANAPIKPPAHLVEQNVPDDHIPH